MKTISTLILVILFIGCAKEQASSAWFESRRELIENEVDDPVLGYMLLRYIDDSEETVGFADLRDYLQDKGIVLKERNYTSMTCEKTESGLELYILKERISGGVEGLGFTVPVETNYLQELKTKAEPDESGNG